MKKLSSIGKKNILIALACVLLIAIAAVFILDSSSRNEQRFAFFLYDGSDTFIAEMINYIMDTKPTNITYAVFDAGNSQSIQNRQIVEFIDNNYDVFIINTVDRLAGSAIVERLSRDGIPIIFFNREPLAEALIGNDNVFYVGAAADVMGVQQAEIAAEFFSDTDTINVVVLKGEHGHQDAEKRTENSLNHLRELGFNVNVLAVRSANWRRQDAFDVMRTLYSQFGGEIDLVFSNNDDMALGAIDFLLSAGIFIEGVEVQEQPFIIISVDGTPVGLEAVYSGLIFGTVHNNISVQSSAILTLADYIVNNRNMASFPYVITNNHFIYINGDIITRDNVLDFMDR
jgi:methyl-galactoside transport system substrate-binding protein